MYNVQLYSCTQCREEEKLRELKVDLKGKKDIKPTKDLFVKLNKIRNLCFTLE